MTTKTKKHIDWKSIAATVHAATETRCACGDHGSWKHTVSGTSGDKPCVWAGCPNCSGSAVGVPLLRGDLAAWRNLSLTQQRELIAVAAVKREFGDHITVGFGVDWRGDDCLVTFFDGDSPRFQRRVQFVDGDTVLAEPVRGYR